MYFNFQVRHGKKNQSRNELNGKVGRENHKTMLLFRLLQQQYSKSVFPHQLLFTFLFLSQSWIIMGVHSVHMLDGRYYLTLLTYKEKSVLLKGSFLSSYIQYKHICAKEIHGLKMPQNFFLKAMLMNVEVILVSDLFLILYKCSSQHLRKYLYSVQEQYTPLLYHKN